MSKKAGFLDMFYGYVQAMDVLFRELIGLGIDYSSETNALKDSTNLRMRMDERQMAAMEGNMETQASFDAVQWLNSNAPGANQLRKESLNSVLHFSLMWNVFEGSLCNQNAGVKQFERVVSELDGREVLRYEYFSSLLDYFRTRYITAGEPNERFMQLRFRRNEKEDLVLSVLKGQESHIPSIVLALLLIVSSGHTL